MSPLPDLCCQLGDSTTLDEYWSGGDGRMDEREVWSIDDEVLTRLRRCVNKNLREGIQTEPCESFVWLSPNRWQKLCQIWVQLLACFPRPRSGLFLHRRLLVSVVIRLQPLPPAVSWCVGLNTTGDLFYFNRLIKLLHNVHCGIFVSIYVF